LGQQRQFPIVTWTDEAIRMFTDHALGPLTTRDLHALIDWIDERPDLAQLPQLRRKLRVLGAGRVRKCSESHGRAFRRHV
jgi:hypothetical protein